MEHPVPQNEMGLNMTKTMRHVNVIVYMTYSEDDIC